ncbi:MAG: T9SS type A sorting domain-containing protein [Ignavibacteriales bacterium]|nr:T9SS type A sorting domain-containing protein [Ignavibacteriales bacterium]
MKKIILLAAIIVSPISAQNVYEVVPGSKGNEIVLSIVNESTSEKARRITVGLVKEPKSVVVNSCSVELSEIKAGEEKEAHFLFDVSRTPEAKKDTLRFKITTNGFEPYEKEIYITYSLPTEYKLEQNYPNPFNPETTIEFSLPKEGKYVLRIFNILGETAKVLADGIFNAGYHKVNFNGSEFSSGVYFYNLVGQDVNLVKKMMLVK